jgi:hypothetical protein
MPDAHYGSQQKIHRVPGVEPHTKWTAPVVKPDGTASADRDGKLVPFSP